MTNELLRRDVVNDDLPIFFEQQLNKEANFMAPLPPKIQPTKPRLQPIGTGFWPMKL